MADLWQEQATQDRRLIERAMRREFRACRGVPHRLQQAMAHSLFGGGKRLRPLLVLWAHDALTRRPAGRDQALRVGAAIEMIHTYSLIHDDLPAMDDDVIRRGRPTCHVAFDEATAVLAGDGLLTLAFGVLAETGARASEVAALAARAAGPAGMVGGQQRDLDAEGQPVTAAAVRRIHEGKTAAMIALSLGAGAICAGASADRLEATMSAGRWLGLAFQGADDVLDVTASSSALGKTPGKDSAHGKATWVRLEGLDLAAARARRYGRRGEAELRRLLPENAAADRLLALAAYMWQRDY